MKKIVGILAAAAMVASVFAADISAATKINGEIFSYGADKTMSLFNQANGSADYANPTFQVSISDDRAGATIKATFNKDNGNVFADTTRTIWFKPFDILKVTVGNYDVALNKEQILWTESWTGLGGDGFLATLDTNGFTLDLGLNEGRGNSWFTKADGVDPVLKNFFVKAGYNADFGSIGAYIAFNKAPNPWDGNYAFYNWNPKTGAITNMDFGAGYKNTFGGITMFVNVLADMDDKFEWVRPEVYAAGNVDAFGWALFAAPLIVANSDVAKALDQTVFCEIVAKLTYRLDAVTVFAQFKDFDILAKKFASEIQLGAESSLGCMSWKTYAKIETGKGDAKDKVAFSVPFELGVNF